MFTPFHADSGKRQERQQACLDAAKLLQRLGERAGYGWGEQQDLAALVGKLQALDVIPMGDLRKEQPFPRSAPIAFSG